jgi:hypothetical protein
MPAIDVPHWVGNWRPDPAWNPALARQSAEQASNDWLI